MTRDKYTTRTVLIRSSAQVTLALAILNHVPVDPDNPLEVIIREHKKIRSPDANAAMWSGPLFDIAEQAWIGGRQYQAETFHEFFKRKFLPEAYDPEVSELVREGYRKWDYDPEDNRVLVGSTTQLTVKGMARYMTQIESFGARLGVQFHVAPNRL